MRQRSKKLAIIGGRVSALNNRLFASASFGKIVEEFAKQYDHIYLSSPCKDAESIEDDYPMPYNLTLIQQPIGRLHWIA